MVSNDLKLGDVFQASDNSGVTYTMDFIGKNPLDFGNVYGANYINPDSGEAMYTRWSSSNEFDVILLGNIFITLDQIDQID